MFGHGSPQHPELPAASFICAFLVLVPLPALWRAGNVATLSIIAWLFVVNVIRGVNTLIWANNIDLRLPVWCDITTKILLGETIALPAAAVCICSYLAAVSDVRTASATLEQRRRRKLFEVFMCYILPMIWMALHYIVQGHRYDIIEHLGCQATVYPSWVALVLLTIFPLVLALVAFAYAVIAIRNFYRRRIDFEKHLQSTNSSLSRGRYLRLMLLASTEMIFDTTANAYTLSFNLTNAGVMLPYTSWADVHSNFSRVQPYPLVLIPTFAWREMLVLWWITPVSTILFFCFFAFGRESMTIYRNWYETLRARFFPRSAKAKAGWFQTFSPLPSPSKISLPEKSAGPIIDDNESFVSGKNPEDLMHLPELPACPPPLPTKDDIYDISHSPLYLDFSHIAVSDLHELANSASIIIPVLGAEWHPTTPSSFFSSDESEMSDEQDRRQSFPKDVSSEVGNDVV